MPRISRIHFASLGHHDARFPTLTLDLRDPQGRPTDTIVWAENGTGKTSLLNLFFSTYQTGRRQFLGKRSQAKARDLDDYVQERDLSFIVTEWDTTDDRATATLLEDAPRELLIVGQMLSWKGLDRSSGELRRLFFTLRPNREVNFEALPVLGLGQPVPSFEAFRDWLNEQARLHPALQAVTETNQGEWRSHLEANHLDPELFAYQLRMNLDEGGVNELFNDLRSDKDFIRLFLELGLDPDTPNRVRANLNEFLPKHHRLDQLRIQVAFNERLLVDLGLFLEQLALFRTAEQQATAVAQEAARLFAALVQVQERLTTDTGELDAKRSTLAEDDTRLESARTVLRRRINYFTDAKAHLDITEAEARRTAAKSARDEAKVAVRLVGMAELLYDLHNREGEAKALETAIAAEQEKARPEREALDRIGAEFKSAVEAEADRAKSRFDETQHAKDKFRSRLEELRNQHIALAREQSAKTQAVNELERFFAERDRQRDRLRVDRLLQPKEEASVASDRLSHAAQLAADTAARILAERTHAVDEHAQVAAQLQTLTGEIVRAEQNFEKISKTINDAEQREESLATHPQLQAAVEAPRADLGLPQTVERLRDHIARLLKQILRLNLDGAEDQRASDYLARHGIFPPSPDAEHVVEQMKAQGVASAMPATQWLAANVTDPDAATRLVAADPAQFQGVMFNPVIDQARAKAVAKSVRAPHVPVQVSPLPDAMPQPAESASLVVLPRHAGGYNRDAAQAEAPALHEQIAERAKQLNVLLPAHDASTNLLNDLNRWLDEFGGGKLASLSEQRRGEQESLQFLRERHRTGTVRQQSLTDTIQRADAAEREQRQRQTDAEKAVTRLQQFIEQYDTPYQEKRGTLDQLQVRLRALETTLAETADEQEQLSGQINTLDTQLAECRDAERDLRKEVTTIAYAGKPVTRARDALPALRVRYHTEVARFEGRFKNTTAQGQLSEKQRQISDINEKLRHEDFSGLDTKRAETLSRIGNLQQQRRETEAAASRADGNLAVAEANLGTAREALRKLTKLSDQDRPAPSDPTPKAATEAAELLTRLDTEATALQTEHEKVRAKADEVVKVLASSRQRIERYAALVTRLKDNGVTGDAPPITLPAEDPEIAASVEQTCGRLRRSRNERQARHEDLEKRYQQIEALTREEQFPRDVNIPARSLFVSMPLEELIGVAGDRRQDVQDQTTILKDELDKMQTHRELIVNELLNESQKAVSLLRRSERLSRMPDDLTGWENEPFLRIHLQYPQSQQEQLTRVRVFVDELLAEEQIPMGVELVYRALLALVTERGIEATILKPETQRRRQRYPVRDMSSWSEGERTTVAILLYCTLVKLRTQSHGQTDRRAEVSALLLDNPIGPCSKPEFLQMQRWIAGQLGVQLIYATGVNDPQALSIFPNRIRLAKNRVVTATGDLAVGLVNNSEDSVVNDIRIFDGLGESKS